MSFKEFLGEEGTFFPRIASGFGGGIGRRGSVCGALTGSVMILGLRFGRTEAEDQDRKEKVYELGHRFWDRFEKAFGSCYCQDLIHCRLDNTEERRKWLASGGLERCASIVEKTAQILSDFLEEVK